MWDGSSSVDEGHGRVIESAFRPHPLLRGPHAQTLFPALTRKPLPLALRRERIKLDDGDFVDVGWAGGNKSPIAVLVHGLGSSIDSAVYLRATASRLIAQGWRICAIQLRGGGPEPNRLPRIYHHGDTGDLRHLLRLLRQREPQTQLCLVGWSLGGNITLKAMAEDGEDSPVSQAIAISVPFQLRPCVEKLRRGITRVIYQNYLMQSLREALRAKHAAQPFGPPADFEAAIAARDFFAFDNAFTAPLNGFDDADDYYARAASGQYLQAIRRPTHIIHALDDPMMLPSIVPSAAALAEAVTLELSARGGHVGFVTADRRGKPRYWLEDRIPELLAPYA
jgi:predicted alpha/beta-fold hydrolase